MPKNKKKFIDKKTATKYTLVPSTLRSIGEDELDPHPAARLTRDELLTRHEEQHQYGIFFNDGYDYMKHLREVNHAGGVLEQQYDFRIGKAASDVLDTQSVASGISRDKSSSFGNSAAASAAATLEAAFKDVGGGDLDPDMIQAMEEDFNFDDPSNILDDDFILQAKGVEEEGEDEYPGLEENDDDLAPDYVDPTRNMHKGRMVEAWIDHQDPMEEEKDQDSQKNRISTAMMIKQWVKSHQGEEEESDDDDDEMEDAQEEKKSHLSKYSMTSSVMRRSNGLRLLDDRFEKMIGQYDDEEIGGLDLDNHEEESGKCLALDALMSEKDESQAVFDAMMLEAPSEPDPIALKFQYEGETGEKIIKVILEQDDDKYDCQSIAESRTSRKFQPKCLDPPRKPRRIILDPVTGIPRESGPQRHEQESDSSNEDAGSDILSLISSLSVPRPKNETPEERKLRKHTLKGLKKERRIEKKLCRVTFKDEKIRQEKEVANVERHLKTIAMV